MINKFRGHNAANASLISMLQRFSDILNMFIGFYIISKINHIFLTLQHIFLTLCVLVMYQMIGGITDFYRSWRGVKLSSELLLVLQNWTISFFITIGILSFILPQIAKPIFFIEWYALVSAGLVLCRILIRHLVGILRQKGYNTRNVAIVGDMAIGRELAGSLTAAPWLGFRVIGMYGSKESDSDKFIVGDIWQVVTDAKEGKIDRVYIAMAMREEANIKKLVNQLYDTTCSVMLIPDIFTFSILQSRPEEINGVSVLSIADTPLSGINMVLKRIEDIVMSILIIIFILPVLVTIASFVKFTSPGPIIFRQLRYGIDGKPIKIWKFRTMTVMEDGNKVVQATKGDSRLTSIGGFLRKTSLDELPQFVNVLLGDMSIVGPRPHAVAHNEQYRGLIKGYMLRHKVKPGITGLAQINGWRGETDTIDKMEKRVEFDLEYIRHWSIWLDLKIIFLTIFKGFIGNNVY